MMIRSDCHMDNKLTHVSLFAGGGGIDVGFSWAGVKTIAAVEMAEYACETLKLNDSDIKLFGPEDPDTGGDVRKFNKKVFDKYFKGTEVDILSGGPPCQPFSIATGQRFGKNDERYKRLGDKDEEKGNLLPEYIRIVNELRPKTFVLENVGELIDWNDGTFLEESLNDLDSDYIYSIPNIVNASKFGVPQYRERMIIIGSRISEKVPVFNDTFLLLDKEFTVDDGLSDFPQCPLNHQLRKHNPETIKRYDKLAFGERDKKGRVDRLDPTKPSKTIIGGGDKGGGRSHLHPYLPRTLSPRESARLQTFPDDYEFCGAVGRQFTQIGNAVPPLLAYFVAIYIKHEILGLYVDCQSDLEKVNHPVVKDIYNHIKALNYKNQDFDVKQISLVL